ncbi:MAG: hypothetical protein U1E65_21615 [Myxococcota bacterium]
MLDSASGCGAGLLGRLRPEQPLLDDYWMPASTCPRAVDVGGTSLFLVAQPGLGLCRTEAGHGLRCVPRILRTGQVLGVSALGDTDALAIVADGTRNALWWSRSATSAPILMGAIEAPVAVSDALILDAAAGGARLHTLAPPAMLGSRPLPGCAAPALLLGPGGGSVATVVCVGPMGARVYALDTSDPMGAPLKTVDVPNLAPTSVARSLDGSLVLLGSAAGGLTILDMQQGVVLGAVPLPPSYPGAALLRAPRADTFFLGGPGPGAVTRVRL